MKGRGKGKLVAGTHLVIKSCFEKFVVFEDFFLVFLLVSLVDLRVANDVGLDGDVGSSIGEARRQNHRAMPRVFELVAWHECVDAVSLGKLMVVVRVSQELPFAKVGVAYHGSGEVVVEVLVPLLIDRKTSALQCSAPQRKVTLGQTVEPSQLEALHEVVAQVWCWK